MLNRHIRRRAGARPARAGILASLLAVSLAPAAQPVVFPHPFDGKPIATPLKDGEVETDALRQFKATGVNSHRQNPSAIAEGKALYEHWCQVCHSADATGKMGPSLVGKAFTYAQTANDAGMFAIVYGGASGAMQGFAVRDLTQDGMLKIIAYVRSITPR